MGNINIGRQGWAGVGLETTPGVGAVPAGYIQFTDNTLQGMVKNSDISNATQNRIKVFDSVPIQHWGAGDIEMYADPNLSAYFLVAALGTVTPSSLGNGVYDNLIQVKNSNSTPQTLTILNDRQGSVDQEAYYNCVVDQLTFTLTDGLATAKASILSNFPQTTASGAATTASGTVYALPSAFFAFGSSVAQADTNAQTANLKTHEFGFTIKNNAKAIFRHGNINPDSINVGDLELETTFKLYFENNTDLQSFYTSKKQCAELLLNGKILPGGLQESTKVRWYQTRIDTLSLETGLSNFYIEDVKMQPEEDNVSGYAIDAVVRSLTQL